ncbi:MAG: UTRA domain-containing protein [Pseudonocardiaceae bacterium]
MEQIPADEEIAAHLRVPVGAPVVARRRVMLADDEPIQLGDSHYPLDMAALRLFSGIPVHRLPRTPFDQHDRPIEVYVVILSGNRHVLLYDVSAE